MLVFHYLRVDQWIIVAIEPSDMAGLIIFVIVIRVREEILIVILVKVLVLVFLVLFGSPFVTFSCLVWKTTSEEVELSNERGYHQVVTE